MADAGKSLAPKSISANAAQILEFLELRGSESLTKNGEILFLEVNVSTDRASAGGDGQATHINAMTIVCDLQQLQTTIFDEDLK